MSEIEQLKERVWKGKNETGREYYCGQILLEGYWKTITQKYPTKELAEREMERQTQTKR